jgi:hypothetical protein
MRPIGGREQRHRPRPAAGWRVVSRRALHYLLRAGTSRAPARASNSKRLLNNAQFKYA